MDALSFDELVDRVVTMVADSRYDSLVPVYLETAMQAILERRYPMDSTKTWEDTEGRYDTKACMVAVELINKRGAEGETSHEESDTRRTYGSAGVSSELLKGIVPMVGVPK